MSVLRFHVAHLIVRDEYGEGEEGGEEGDDDEEEEEEDDDDDDDEDVDEKDEEDEYEPEEEEEEDDEDNEEEDDDDDGDVDDSDDDDDNMFLWPRVVPDAAGVFCQVRLGGEFGEDRSSRRGLELRSVDNGVPGRLD